MSKEARALARREREVMDILYLHGPASAEEIQQRMPDPPSNSAVRALLRVLVEKGQVTHSKAGRKFIYRPVVPRRKARLQALRKVVRVFFDDSPDQAVAALLDMRDSDLSQENLERLARMVKRRPGEEK